MKTHYVPIIGRAKDKALCNRTVSTDQLTNDLRKTDCLRCIGAMSEFEKIWHEKNNAAYQKHMAGDGRRRGNVKTIKEIADSIPKPVYIDMHPPAISSQRRREANKSELQRLGAWLKSFFIGGG